MKQDFIEKRRYLRVNSRIPMRYRRIGLDASEFKGSLMKDISAGGTRMTSFEFLPLNARLNMEIPLGAGTKPVQGVCRVAWVRKTGSSEQYDVGVEFDSLTQGDTGQIADFVLSIFNNKNGKKEQSK